MTKTNPFEQIYKYNLWLTGSGTGSLPWNNRPYIQHLNMIIQKYNPRTIVEIGCGDCRLWDEINYHGKYVGIDIVQNKIPATHKFHKNYIQMDILEKSIIDGMAGQTIDLVIIKDLFVHLPKSKINKMLVKVQELNPKYFLTVEDGHYLSQADWKLTEGSYRPVRINLDYPIIETLEYYEITYLVWINLWISLAFILLLTRNYIWSALVFMIIMLWIPKKRSALYKIANPEDR